MESCRNSVSFEDDRRLLSKTLQDGADTPASERQTLGMQEKTGGNWSC